MKKVLSVFLYCLLMITQFSLCGCNLLLKEDKNETAADSLSVLSWNVQALFDGEDQGTEYDAYSVSEGWSKEKYKARLNAIAKGIISLPKSPDLIGFIEVENADILEDMVSTVLKKEGYRWTFFSRNPGGALGIGIISKYPLNVTKSHSIIFDGEINPRPMAEVRLNVRNQPVALFVCHWKSKLGNPELTEAQRKASARLVLRRVKELETEIPGIPIIVMGDLNENHDEFYRTGGSFITALLPDDPNAASLVNTVFGVASESMPAAADALADFLVISKKKTQTSEYFDFPHNLFYTPWGNELKNGSYVYRENWETIDHFLLRPSLYDGTGWDIASCKTLALSPFITAAGIPASYNPRTGWGLSDHLPLLLTMTLQQEQPFRLEVIAKLSI